MSTFWRRRRPNGDEGVTLVLALVFLALVGLFAVVGLEKSQSTLLSGTTVRDRGGIQYSLDGAVEKGLQVLRTDMADADPSQCAQSTAPTATGTLTVNGVTSTWTCTLLAGRAKKSSDATTTDYAIVVTSSSAGAFSTSGGASSATINIGGSVFLNSAPTSSGPTAVGTNVNLAGDLLGTTAASCSTLAAFSAITVDNGFLKTCTDQTVSEAVPALALPPAPPAISASLQNGIQVGTCRVFYPGTYTSAPGVDVNGANYFVSGLYQFSNIGTWTLNNNGLTIDGGKRVRSTDSPADTTSGCSAMTDGMATGLGAATTYIAGLPGSALFSSGVTWVMSGNSTLDASKGDINLFSPPVYGSSAQPVAFVQLSSSLGLSPPSGYTAGTSATPLNMTNNGLQMFVNGKIYAPSGAVNLFATNSTYAVARGGIVASKLDLKISSSISSTTVEISSTGGTSNPPPPFRTVKVVSTTTGTSATNTAVATISNFGTYKVLVKSWRTS